MKYFIVTPYGDKLFESKNKLEILTKWNSIKDGSILLDEKLIKIIKTTNIFFIKKEKEHTSLIENYYVKKGKPAHWWSGWNILTVGQK